jgi:hypothetical protein
MNNIFGAILISIVIVVSLTTIGFVVKKFSDTQDAIVKIEETEISKWVDPKYGVVCYWKGSSPISCVKVGPVSLDE